jgi:DNA-binding MarR family transcriptional regulator
MQASPQNEAEEFHHALSDLVRLQQHRARDRVAFYGITVAGAHALDALERLGTATLNRLAAELFVDKSTASRIIAVLEYRGWVARTLDPRDRRALRLRLTDEGFALQEQLRSDAVWEMQAVLAGTDPVVRHTVLGFLRDLARTSALHAGSTEASCCRGD